MAQDYRWIIPDENVFLSHICYLLIFILFYPNLKLIKLVFPCYLLHTFNFYTHCSNLCFCLFSSQFVLLTSKTWPTYPSVACQTFTKSSTINWPWWSTIASVVAVQIIGLQITVYWLSTISTIYLYSRNHTKISVEM